MKRFALYIGLAAAMVASCSTQEKDFQTPPQDDVVFYASFEQPADEGTRVYANEDLLLRWTADDRVSIFEKNTYNQQFRFTGETGDNAGGFKKVVGDDYYTGNSIPNVVSVYPYLETTKISESGVLTVDLPAEQHYAENTFGLGANTMVSVSADNFLQYKNVGGYLVLKLYGDGVSVSSVTLKGNNGEKLAGKGTVTMPLDGTPTVVLAEDASDEINLVCDTPVALGATAEESKDFWFVVPPVTLSMGFTISVNQTIGGVFEKTTSKSLTIERSNLTKMSELEVERLIPSGNIVFADEKVKQKLVAAFDTNGDGELSYEAAAAVTNANDIKTAFGAIKTYKSFDEFQYFTGVTIIPNQMFENWNLLSSIILPNRITTIGSSVFSGCIKLGAVSIPSDVTSIGSSAFAGCSSLSGIVIPERVSSIGEKAFQNCSALSSVSISASVTKLSNYLFSGCTELSSIIIPSTITSIGSYAFENCTSLTSFVSPASLTSIGSGSFSGCSNLASVVFSEVVSTIGDNAFADCLSLVSIIIPDSVGTIKGNAFRGCSNLKEVTLPKYLPKIEGGLFYACSSLESISIPDSVSAIDGGAFSYCTSLVSIDIPESVTVIGFDAFYGCSSLTSVLIPESVTIIGGYAFQECTSLSSIVLPNSVSTIGDQAFSFCSSLLEITIPESVTSIGNSVFAGCSSLYSIVVAPDNPIYDSRGNCNAIIESSSNTLLYGCKTTIIPDTITKIGKGAFYQCTGLTCISIPNGVVSIEQNAFRLCSGLLAITIPASVKSIGSWTFAYCEQLTQITVYPPEPPSANSYMFFNTNNCPILVPASSVSTYKTATYWSEYASRIQAIASVPEAVDLGLPSGLKWASFNLGASKPEDYGDYYAWGEVEPYYSSLDPLIWKEGKEEGYDWVSYKWCMGSKNTLTKYCPEPSSYGYNGFTDTKTLLDLEDDAAHVNLGGNWRIPTHSEFTELWNNCTWEWTSVNGINGRKVTGPNGKSIFLPGAGGCYHTSRDGLGSSAGFYWSSSLYTDNPIYAKGVNFGSGDVGIGSADARFYGRSVRPVCD